MEKLTLELVESRLQELSKEHKLDIMDEKLLRMVINVLTNLKRFHLRVNSNPSI